MDVLFDAIDSMEEAFVAYDKDGCLIACNSAFRKMYNYTLEQARPGVHFRELGEIDVRQGNVAIGDDIGADYLSRKEAYRRELKGSFTVELKDGRWIRTTDRRMSNGGFVSLQVDITEIKAFEAQLTEAKALAEAANQAKSEFLATMSHELRTPLTSIQGALGLMANGAVGDLGEEARELALLAHRNSERLTIMVNDILDMEKIEAGSLSYTFMRHDLIEIIGHAIATMEAYAAEREVRMQLSQSLDRAMTVIDDRRISQVLVNLLSNAAKFSHPGGQIKIALVQEEGRYRISIEDNGQGIPAELSDKIFDIFTMADGSDSRHTGGVGLGLSISKSIVERHGGKLEFTSVMGEGTTFYFDLPVDD